MFIKHPDLTALSTIKEKTIQSRVKSVFVLHALPAKGVKEQPIAVLLLHGAKFSTKTWDSVGTIADLTEQGRSMNSDK